MGQPKALLPFPATVATPGKVTFLDHLMEMARHPKIGITRIVLGANAEKIQQRLQYPPSAYVVNERWKEGQLSSIQAAIHSLAHTEADGMMLFLVDHPLISKHLVTTLVEVFYSTNAPIVIPSHAGKRGHPMIFSSRMFAELLAAPAEVGARAVVWEHYAEVKEVATDEKGVTLNLNDPDSLRKALGADD